ncbi:MAG: TVP38/TMEM64 family protein [Clostridium sp.]
MIANAVVYFIICFLQPIILPLPEPVTIVTGSTIFGRFNGAIIGFLGTTLGIITMYFISIYIGEKYLSKLVKKDHLDRFNNYIRRNETLILLLLFIFPLLPDEVICIGAGIARLNACKFIVIACLGKLITSFTLSYSIEMFSFDAQTIIVCFCLVVILIAIKSLVQNRRECR